MSARTAKHVSHSRQGNPREQPWGETLLPKTTRTLVTELSTSPNVPAQTQQLRSTLGAEVWLVHFVRGRSVVSSQLSVVHRCCMVIMIATAAGFGVPPLTTDY